MVTTTLRGPVQIAYAVEDVDDAARRWAARGIGPWVVRHHIEVTSSRVRGADRAFDHSSAYGWSGNTMIELIAEHHDGVDRIGPKSGVHHMAYFVDDLVAAQQALADAGMAEQLFATAGSTSFALHDGGELGHLIEVYEPSDGLRGFYESARVAAETWDGNAAIRVI